MINKLYLCITLLLFVNSSIASNVYDDYESYYQTLQNPIFSIKYKQEINNLPWSGDAFKKYKTIVFNHKYIAINGKRIPLKNAKIFKGELPDTDSSITGDYLYLAKNHICIEAIYPSASGISARHKSIYLVDTKKIATNKMTLYKLPSLFGSCWELDLAIKMRFI